MEQEILNIVNKYPSLNSTQVQKCREETNRQLLTQIGEEPPVLEDFTQYVGEPPDKDGYLLDRSWLKDIQSIVIPTDYLMIPILLIMLAISLAHMLSFSGEIAMLSWSEVADNFEGIYTPLLVWVLVHQIGLFGMSEIGVILFYTANSMDYNKLSEDKKKVTSKYKTMNFAVALSFALMTIVANVSSLLHRTVQNFSFEQLPVMIVLAAVGILIPVVTMFLGERFAQIILTVINMREKREQDYFDERTRYSVRMENARIRYKDALETWAGYHENLETHPSYRSRLAMVIAEYYKRNMFYYEGKEKYKLPVEDWTPALERALAARELAHLKRMEDIDEAVNFFSNPEGIQ